MSARAAIALTLAVFASTVSARAQDDPACAKYSDPMAYNLCLARHGPKANGVGRLHGGPQSGHVGQDRRSYGQTQRRAHSPQAAHRVHGRVHMEFRVR